MVEERLLELLRGTDSFALVEEVSGGQDPLTAARTLHDLGKHLYWNEKNLAGCVALLRAGAQIGLTAAGADAPGYNDLRSEAKGMCYDTASFTWAGWDEPGIVISGSYAFVGLDAARANLRLAEELNKGDLPLSRAHWMLAGHLLAAQRYSEAIDHFERGATHASRAESSPNLLLCNGFAALTSLVESPESRESAQRLEAIKAELAPLDHGDDFISQINTAARVFASPASVSA